MSRTVFKLLGALGPGGTVAILMEKFISAFYYEGYEIKDPNTFENEAE